MERHALFFAHLMYGFQMSERQYGSSRGIMRRFDASDGGSEFMRRNFRRGECRRQRIMLIAGVILLTATEGTLAKNAGDNAIKNNNVEGSGVGKEKHKEKGKGAGAGTVTATGNRLVVSPPAYGPPAGGAGGY